jgi:hypothetical protein
MRLLGFWRDELREDKDLNGLLSLKLAKKKQKALNALILCICNIKCDKHNIMCEINNGG